MPPTNFYDWAVVSAHPADGHLGILLLFQFSRLNAVGDAHKVKL